jgi:large subunit ribosomal protein L29
MKAAKWRDLSEDEMRQKAQELTEEIFNLRFQLSTGVAKNPARLGEARRDLARARTILAERGLPAVKTTPPAPPPAPARSAAPKARTPRKTKSQPARRSVARTAKRKTG